MFWQEEEDKTLPYKVPLDIVDIGFKIKCKRLALDHAWELSQQVQEILPWLATEPQAGIHQIHVANSANGWMRPEDTTNEVLLPSHRTRLYLRIPQTRIKDSKKLIGKTLPLQHSALTIIARPRIKSLVNSSVIFSRYVITTTGENETYFLNRMVKEIKHLTNFNVKKMLCGKKHTIKTDITSYLTRHLMIADLNTYPAIKIQQYGLGTGRKLGCGIFLPHKGIKTLKPTE